MVNNQCRMNRSPKSEVKENQQTTKYTNRDELSSMVPLRSNSMIEFKSLKTLSDKNR
jgi:hypothetical protein